MKNLKEKGLIIYSKSNDTKTTVLTDMGRAAAEKLFDGKSILAKSKLKKQRIGLNKSTTLGQLFFHRIIPLKAVKAA